MSSSSIRWITLTVCSLLLLGFAVASWCAERTKCATYDEPVQSVAGFVLCRDGDYRVNPEDPPLWERWANLLEPHDALRLNEQDPRFPAILRSLDERRSWLNDTLYRTPGNDPDAFMARQRLMMLFLGITLGAMIAWWSWQLAGPVAAIAATALFSLDPNFLAHSVMIKNDVAITLVGLALCYATWRMGRRLSVGWGLAVTVLAAISTVIKFSWPLLLIALFLLLLLRVLLPSPWAWRQQAIVKRSVRLCVAVGLLLAIGAAGYLMIWANYSFRFAPSPGGQQWDIQPLLMETEINDLAARHVERKSTLVELQAWQPNTLLRGALYCGEHQLLPSTYLYGLIFTYDKSRLRGNFLCGVTGLLGKWHYFPLAFVFKMPLATLAAVLLAAIVAALSIPFRRAKSISSDALWTVACLVVPALVFAVAVMSSNVNIGFRHFFPVMPFIYIAVAGAMATIWKRWGRNGRLMLAGLAAGLVAESSLAYPDFLAFFNGACGGSTGGIRLLGDSNLDWGQDLPLLASWQKANPKLKLYLSYFGSADPEYYGIRGESIVGDYSRTPETDIPRQPGVIAISATNLQGTYLPPESRAKIKALVEKSKPIDILGGTIYLYLFNP